ncbi:putative glycosidase [Zalerion maritima]|uniref:Glycosidase n=1 Tax=Zalerion maritima TaxID=339359 RepID=A0AAD5RWJ7_9PEZI|nr:putative glycosidase [Zalerion maritima]
MTKMTKGQKVTLVFGTIGALLLIIAMIVTTIWLWVPMAKYPKYSNLDYELVEVYNGTEFFENFHFSGEVSGDNDQESLLRYKAGQWNAAGRASVLVSSYSKFQRGLFVFNILHTPHGCGVWAQLRLQDVDRFPDHGEITVMDSVHNGTTGNIMGMFVHATHCDMDPPNVYRRGTGHVDGPTSTCSQRLHGRKGCRFIGRNDTFGPQFNAERHHGGGHGSASATVTGASGGENSSARGGGGAVAVEWRQEGIRHPVADFPHTHCTITEPNLKDLKVVININMCGLRPEHSWSDSGCCPGPGCSKDDETCRRFVASHPEAMENAYWEFESIKIFDEAPPLKDEV